MPLEVQLSMCSAYGDKKAAALWVVVKAELQTGLMDWTNYGLKFGLMLSSMWDISYWESFPRLEQRFCMQLSKLVTVGVNVCKCYLLVDI